MTREEAIERWQYIAQAVILAEKRINKEWFDKLKDAQSLPPLARCKLSMDYCKAVAIEIVNGTSDEYIKQMTQ